MTDAATEQLVEFDLLIGGEPSAAASGSTYDSVDPYTGRPWARVPDGGTADVDRAVAAARAALNGPWGALTATARGKLLRRLGEIIAREAEQLAEFEVRDGGKLVREMVGQMRSLPDYYFYYGGLADKLQGDVIPVDKPNYFVYTRHEPVGVVGAITPWNSPLLLLTWKLAAGLAAGCTFVVKPSDHTPTSTLAFAKLFAEAGFPPGVITSSPAGAGDGRRARVAPGRRQDRLHGVDGDRHPRRQGRDREHDPALAGTRRQVSAGGVRRRRPRCRGQRGDRRRLRRYRPDVSGGLAPSRRTQRRRCPGGQDRRAGGDHQTG